MPRRRRGKNKGLPPNLYYDLTTTHYRFRNPENGKWHPMGKDRFKAISAAKQLNSLLMPGQDLIARVMGTTITLDQYIDRFENVILPERALSKNTLYDYYNKFVKIRSELGEKQIDEISVKQIAEFLANFPPTQSNRYRSLLINIFKHALAEGLVPENPAASTLNRKLKKKRSRLNLKGYRAIYNMADQWLKNAMDLGLQTLQRREDLCEMKFSDIKGGYLYVIQKKTEKHGTAAYIKIQIDKPLQEVINQCRDAVASPYIIHRLPTQINKSIHQTKTKTHHTQVSPDYLTKAFSTARDECGYFDNLSTEEKPTFHEIRSLGIKLYEDAGIDAQSLAGHTDRAMTERYKEGHEIEWTEVSAGINV